MYACISVSNREKNLNHWGHLIDRRCLVIIETNSTKLIQYAFGEKSLHLLIFAGCHLTIVFKDNIEPANIKIII